MSDINIITISPEGEVHIVASNKVTKWYLEQLATDGKIEFETDEDDPDADLDAEYEDLEEDIRRGPAPKKPQYRDGAELTNALREVWREMVKHPNGAHYTAIAENLGIDLNAINARCCVLVNKGWASRLGGADTRSGVYVPAAMA